MRYVALLRGINVTGKNKIAMNELRALAESMGLLQIGTYIQSGNLVFESDLKATQLERDLETTIEQQFGLTIPVIVRSRTQWMHYASGSAYPKAESARPNMLLLALCKKPLLMTAADELITRATLGERATALKDGLWIDFPHGSGRSKLTPSILDRVCGAPVTTRNFNTVTKIAELL
jgi:uncharacterized protein (DUF1697 family)